jgi:hypothetical protein
MRCRLTRIASWWTGRRETNWRHLGYAALGEFEETGQRVGMTRCVDVIGDDFVPGILS